MTLGIALKVSLDNATINALPRVEKLEFGYRDYSHGPACVQVIGRDVDGKQTLAMDIPVSIAQTLVDGIEDVLKERHNRPPIR